ncbi:MAG: 50S ribosomal protein L18 [Candidatus Aenigmarchaeota archaeon]|nr:50S ribosomal protein L18 [Candidatus Aenigmarchaeota archaeon]
MKRSRTLVLPHRRKREGKTDYRQRLKLLKSGKPRFVVRRSSNNIICQIVSYETKGDKVVVTSDSKELSKYGWKAHCGNLPSAYLTGLLCGVKAKEKGVKEAILDMGLYASTQGNRLFSALKGAIDGGISIPHSDEVLPNPERFSGAHIANFAQLLKKNEPEKYKKVFSAYLKNNVEPENIQKIFEDAKKKISSGPAKKAVPKKQTKAHAKK